MQERDSPSRPSARRLRGTAQGFCTGCVPLQYNQTIGWNEKDRRGPEMCSCMHLLFSSPLTGVWKKGFRTQCMHVASPGTRVSQAWEKVRAMNGTLPLMLRLLLSGCRGKREGRRVRMQSEVEDPMGEVWVLVDWGSSCLRWEVAVEKGR